MQIWRLNTNAFLPPEGFKDDLSEYGVQLTDGWCGEPIGWGFSVRKQIGPERWEQLKVFGDLVCNHELRSRWYLITRWLTRDEAEELYGVKTEEVWGPKGGWKSVTFGEKRFITRHLRSNPPLQLDRTMKTVAKQGRPSHLPEEVEIRIRELRRTMTLVEAAAKLTEEGVPTPSGQGKWHGSMVRRHS